MRILVADDNNANRLIARAILEREGHEVVLARSGAEAVQAVERQGFGAVLLDILMPGMDGVRVFRRIHAMHPELTVLALTSYDSPADVRRYLAAGFDGIIAKPLNPGDFARALHLVDTGAPAILGSAPRRAADAEALPLLDLTVIESGVGQAPRDTARAVLRHYKASLGAALDTLQRTLPGALALQPAELREFRDALHALKSASAMIGLSRAPALAGRLRNAPPGELREGVTRLLVAVRDSLPELERALTQAPSREPGALVAFRQVGPAVQVGGQHEPETAHDHQHYRAPV